MVQRLAWIVAVTLGLLAGGFAFHFPGSYGEAAWSVSAGIFGFLIGGVNGLLVGALTETPLGWSQDHAWDGLIAGLVWGSATAVFGLPGALYRHQRPTRPSTTLVPD